MEERYKLSLSKLCAQTYKLSTYAMDDITKLGNGTISISSAEVALHTLDYLREVYENSSRGWTAFNDILARLQEIYGAALPADKIKKLLDDMSRLDCIEFPGFKTEDFNYQYRRETAYLEKSADGQKYRIYGTGLLMFTIADTIKRIEFLPNYLKNMRTAITMNPPDYNEFIDIGSSILIKLDEYIMNAYDDISEYKKNILESDTLVKKWHNYHAILDNLISDNPLECNTPSLARLIREADENKFDTRKATKDECLSVISSLNGKMRALSRQISRMITMAGQKTSLQMQNNTLRSVIDTFWNHNINFEGRKKLYTNLGFWNSRTSGFWFLDAAMPLPHLEESQEEDRNPDKMLSVSIKPAKTNDHQNEIGDELRALDQLFYKKLATGPKKASELMSSPELKFSSDSEFYLALAALANLNKIHSDVSKTKLEHSRFTIATGSSTTFCMDDTVFTLENNNAL